MRERDRVRGATSPERPDPSPRPSPAWERGRVAPSHRPLRATLTRDRARHGPPAPAGSGRNGSPDRPPARGSAAAG
ncbi:MAG: hypothetical protein CMH16_12675 [Methylobacterium sp.]|nr:hypothetical protein [Methylobacterium sp.]